MARPTNASSALSSLSLADLKREVDRRQRRHPALQRRRAALLKQLAAISAELGDAPSTPATRGPGRPKGSKNRKASDRAPARKRAKNKIALVDVLATVLKGKTMTIGEAIDAVRKAGYKSESANFRTMVNIALIKKDRFTRVAKGKYTAK